MNDPHDPPPSEPFPLPKRPPQSEGFPLPKRPPQSEGLPLPKRPAPSEPLPLPKPPAPRDPWLPKQSSPPDSWAPPKAPPPRAPAPFTLDPDTPRHPPAPPPPRVPPPERPRRADRRAPEEPKSRKGLWVLFIAVNVVAIGIAVFWMTRTEETKRKFLEQIPPGAGGRAIAAVACLVVMVVLARIVLPGARMAILSLSEAGRWFRRQSLGKRLLLLPAQAGLEVVWLGAQVLFALDAIAILLSGVAFLLYAIKIAKPDLFPFLP